MSASFFSALHKKIFRHKKETRSERAHSALQAQRGPAGPVEARHAWLFMGGPRISLPSLGAAAAPRKNCEGRQGVSRPSPQARSIVSRRKGGAAAKIGLRPAHLGVSIAQSIDAPR